MEKKTQVLNIKALRLSFAGFLNSAMKKKGGVNSNIAFPINLCSLFYIFFVDERKPKSWNESNFFFIEGEKKSTKIWYFNRNIKNDEKFFYTYNRFMFVLLK